MILPLLLLLSIIVLPIIILIKSIKQHNAEISKVNNMQQQENHIKYCSICGAQLHEQAIVCTNCGCAIKQQTNDSNSTIFNVLSYISPLVGLILYSIYKDDKPIKALGCKKFALIGLVALAAILGITIVFVLYVLITSNF